MLQVIDTRNGELEAFKATAEDDISLWAARYFHLHVKGAPIHTQRAKKGDLEKFLSFFHTMLRSSIPDLWTPAITKGFQNHLSQQLSPKTGQPYVATSINRILATVKHFSSWLNKERKLAGGNPFSGVRLIHIEDPEWNGLTETEVIRLRSACEIRLNACTKRLQNPLLEYVVFSILLHTGLRESELVSLNVEQYHSGGFHNVKRKGSKVTRKVPIVSDTRTLLDQYLATRNNPGPQAPLLISRYSNRLGTRDVARICARIANQANTHLPQDQKIRLAPHMLRHTFLKRVADKHGLHVAQNLSGNVSIKEIFRYAKPSSAQKQEIVENLF